jgi:polyisoprenoid-binding protein YceI
VDVAIQPIIAGAPGAHRPGRGYGRVFGRSLAALGCLAVALAGPAAAAPRTLALGPANPPNGFRVYGFGLLPVDGTFSRFTGAWHDDPDHPADCSVELSAEVDSLAMPSAAMRATALAAGMLDAAGFPAMGFHGGCAGPMIAGDLTLHGLHGPMLFRLTRHRGRLEAEASLRRADWGMRGEPGLVGNSVEIRIVLDDPQVR